MHVYKGKGDIHTIYQREMSKEHEDVAHEKKNEMKHDTIEL